jgi:hypothetical protein
MYLVYIDDSGDTGLPSQTKTITKGYVLSAMLIKDTNWLTTLDQFVRFRRFLYQQFRIKQGSELKASFLIHGNGAFEKLKTSNDARMKIYKMALHLQVKIGGIINWAVVIDKSKWEAKNYQMSLLEASWRMMFERLERFTTKNNETCMVFPDQGNEVYVKGLLREMRRFNNPNSAYTKRVLLKRELNKLVEDPNFRISHESYFIQMADLNAYAAHRHIFPEPWFGSEYWDYLGDTRLEDVNRLRKGPKGIVLRP